VQCKYVLGVYGERVGCLEGYEERGNSESALESTTLLVHCTYKTIYYDFI